MPGWGSRPGVLLIKIVYKTNFFLEDELEDILKDEEKEVDDDNGDDDDNNKDEDDEDDESDNNGDNISVGSIIAFALIISKVIW